MSVLLFTHLLTVAFLSFFVRFFLGDNFVQAPDFPMFGT